MANPFPFVAGNVLTAAELNGIGEWTSYTPVLTAATTNPTLGTGSSAVGSYARIQNLIIYNFLIRFGSSGVVPGVGIYSVSLPVTASAVTQYYTIQSGFTQFFDQSANAVYPATTYIETTSKIGLFFNSSFNGPLNSISATAPVIPAVNDGISGLIIYRAA
jgi:hypothetical protein